MRRTNFFAALALLALPLATGCAAGVENGSHAELAEGEEAFAYDERVPELGERPELAPGARPSFDAERVAGVERPEENSAGADEEGAEEDFGGLDGRTPESASTTLYDAWLRDDRELARSVARAEVVSELFAVSPEGAAWSFDGCIEEGEGFACGFWYEGGYASLRVEDQGTDEHLVVALTFGAD